MRNVYSIEERMNKKTTAQDLAQVNFFDSVCVYANGDACKFE